MVRQKDMAVYTKWVQKIGVKIYFPFSTKGQRKEVLKPRGGGI